MKTLLRALAALTFSLFAFAAPAHAQQTQWDNVARVVVIGDLEGDYHKFTDMLRTAGLIDEHNAWIGGATHLVQLGDIPDRGPNSRMIFDLLIELEPQARAAGGYVHALIGNHEAMNVQGDLRYVHPGEYAAFVDRGSERRRNAFYRRWVAHLRENPPASGLPVFDDAYRARWDGEHPLGYVEHREAWAPNGRYGRWIATHDSVIRINDTLYMHGGLGPSFLNADRDDMNNAVREALNGRPVAAYADILDNQEGPLWYRGLAMTPEETERPHLEALLARHGVARIVIGHSKVAPTVFPRFGGRVLVTDIARQVSDPHAFLIIENGEPITVHRGHRIPIVAGTPEQRCSYLRQIMAYESGGQIVGLVDQCTDALNGTQ
ncbi:MAG: metallophosphoesterase [Hyphomonadaceae bacterium]